MLSPYELKRLFRVYGNDLTFKDCGWHVVIERLGRVFGHARYSEVISIFGSHQ